MVSTCIVLLSVARIAVLPHNAVPVSDRTGAATWHIGHGSIPYTANFILEAVVAKWQGTAGHSTEVRSARMDHLAVAFVLVSHEYSVGYQPAKPLMTR